jgi:hypothetical protein
MLKAEGNLDSNYGGTKLRSPISNLKSRLALTPNTVAQN